MDMKEALKKAISFEEKGYEIYLETAKKTKNPVVKTTFDYLAEQELKHKEILIDYGKKKIDYKHIMDDRAQIIDFFKTNILEFKAKAALSKDDVKAHEIGLELEKSSYEYYKEHRDKAGDQTLKQFFGFMMEQENMHYELIDKAYWYIKDPVAFNAAEEKWFVEGG